MTHFDGSRSTASSILKKPLHGSFITLCECGAVPVAIQRRPHLNLNISFNYESLFAVINITTDLERLQPAVPENWPADVRSQRTGEVKGQCPALSFSG